MKTNILPTFMQSKIASILNSHHDSFWVDIDTCLNGINDEKYAIPLPLEYAEVFGNRTYKFEIGEHTFEIFLDSHNIQPAIYRLAELYVIENKELCFDEDEITDLFCETLSEIVVDAEKETIDIIINE